MNDYSNRIANYANSQVDKFNDYKKTIQNSSSSLYVQEKLKDCHTFVADAKTRASQTVEDCFIRAIASSPFFSQAAKNTITLERSYYDSLKMGDRPDDKKVRKNQENIAKMDDYADKIQLQENKNQLRKIKKEFETLDYTQKNSIQSVMKQASLVKQDAPVLKHTVETTRALIKQFEDVDNFKSDKITKLNDDGSSRSDGLKADKLKNRISAEIKSAYESLSSEDKAKLAPRLAAAGLNVDGAATTREPFRGTAVANMFAGLVFNETEVKTKALDLGLNLSAKVEKSDPKAIQQLLDHFKMSDITYQGKNMTVGDLIKEITQVTGKQGISSHESLSAMHRLLEEFITDPNLTPKQMETFSAIKDRIKGEYDLLQGKQRAELKINNLNPERKERIAQNLSKDVLSKLKEGDQVGQFVGAGWSHTPDGISGAHVINFEILKTGPDSYTCHVYNAGDGTEYHKTPSTGGIDYRNPNAPPLDPSKAVITVNSYQISGAAAAENLVKDIILMRAGTGSPDQFYGLFNTPGITKLEHDENAPQTIPQSIGNCAVRSIEEAIFHITQRTDVDKNGQFPAFLSNKLKEYAANYPALQSKILTEAEITAKTPVITRTPEEQQIIDKEKQRIKDNKKEFDFINSFVKNNNFDNIELFTGKTKVDALEFVKNNKLPETEEEWTQFLNKKMRPPQT